MKALKVSGPPGTELVDARGKPCPWPIILLARALKTHSRVELWADDPAAQADLESFCASTGADLASVERAGAALKAVITARGHEALTYSVSRPTKSGGES